MIYNMATFVRVLVTLILGVIMVASLFVSIESAGLFLIALAGPHIIVWSLITGPSMSFSNDRHPYMRRIGLHGFGTFLWLIALAIESHTSHTLPGVESPFDSFLLNSIGVTGGAAIFGALIVLVGEGGARFLDFCRTGSWSCP